MTKCISMAKCFSLLKQRALHAACICVIASALLVVEAAPRIRVHATAATTGRSPHAASGNSRPPLLPGCILMLDDRYGGLAKTGSVTAAEAERMEYYEATFHINRLYAARHGYRFVAQGAGKYAPGALRHMSWLKLQMLADELACCCQWALFMDSDSFLVMLDHELSIEAWLAKDDAPAATTLLGNMYSLPGSDARLRRGTEPVAVISDNVPWTAASYFCAGNLLFTQTQLSFEILNYWFNETVQLDQSSLTRHPWEQKTLNNFVMHRYSRAFWVVPSSEMNSFNGGLIRHLWSPYGNDARTRLSVQHLTEVLQRQ